MCSCWTDESANESQLCIYYFTIYECLFSLFVCDSALIELAFPLEFLVFHFTKLENSLLD